MASPFKSVVMRPLTGPMDSRSNPEDCPPLSFRFKLNMEVDTSDRLGRGYGWDKLLYKASSYVNQDAHDQGDCYDPTQTREPITFLSEFTRTDQARKLYYGTRSRLALLNEHDGQWITIARGFGGGSPSDTQIRWSAGQSADTLVFTNGIDKPQSHVIGVSPSNCGENSVAEISELNTLKVTQARLATQFSGCVFLMGVTQEGTFYPSRIRWSGVNKPLKWVSGADTVAGFQDLPYTETILGAVELQGNLVIFTDQSIYRCYVNGNTFGFTRSYTDPTGRDRCLVYPDTLVTDGSSCYYAGRDGFYHWNLYVQQPERPDWLWRSSNLVFDNLDTSCCRGPVGQYWPEKKSILWSWPKSGDNCQPYRTIHANLRSMTAHIIDHGFTAFTSFRSDDQMTIGDLLDTCTTDLRTFCAYLGDKRLIEFCQACNTRQIIVGASSEDWCLKEIGSSYHREVCTNSATGTGGLGPDGNYAPFVGTYESKGYFSILRGMFPLGNMDREKQINDFLINARTEFLLGNINYWRLRVGTSYEARDANPDGNVLAFAYPGDDLAPEYVAEFSTDGGYCEVLWHLQSDREIHCVDMDTEAQYLAKNTRPSEGRNWPLFEQGRFLYYEITAISKDHLGMVVPPVGAPFILSRVQTQARVMQA